MTENAQLLFSPHPSKGSSTKAIFFLSSLTGRNFNLWVVTSNQLPAAEDSGIFFFVKETRLLGGMYVCV